MKRLFLTLALLCLSGGALQADEPELDISGAVVAGRYETDFGTLVLSQQGDRVTGTYSGEYNGRIEGRLSGWKLSFRWTQPDGQSGRGVFNFFFDMTEQTLPRFTGTWGAGESEDDGGTWNGQQIAPR